MNRLSALLLMIVCAYLTVCARSVEVQCSEQGELSEIESPETVSNLIVHGVVDASDLDFIAKKMTVLVSLDLSDATITDYFGKSVNGRKRFRANFIPDGIFAAAPFATIALPKAEGLAIGDAAFSGASLTELEIGDNVISIGLGAFSACKDLVKLSLSAKTVSEGYTFADCTSLQQADISGINRLPESIFSGCLSLNEVTGTESLTVIADRAFAGCPSLNTFVFGSGLQQIGSEAFFASNLQQANMSKCQRLTDIGDWAFAKCSSLESVIFGGAVTRMGEGVFFDCANLKKAAYPMSITSIPNYTFKGAESLESLSEILHGNIATIGDYSFKDVGNVSSLRLPGNVEYIGAYAMEGMSALNTINAGTLSRVPDLGENVWNGLEQAEIELRVKSDMVTFFTTAEQWLEFDIKESAGIDEIKVDDAGGKIFARFSGKILQVDSSASGKLLDEIRLYNAVSGAEARRLTVGDFKMETDTSDVDGMFFVVVCQLVDGQQVILKLMRK